MLKFLCYSVRSAALINLCFITNLTIMNYLKGLLVFSIFLLSSTIYSQSSSIDCDDETDTSPPTVFCLSQIIIVLDQHEVEIWATDLNIGSFDNCTENEDLIFSFDSIEVVETMIVDCDHVINAPVVVDMYVIDESGNYESCSVAITANPVSTLDCYEVEGPIEGVVTKYNGDPIEGAEVILNGSGLELPRITFTDQFGRYSFPELPVSTYQLSVSKERHPLDGVTTLDLVLILRHILGLQPLSSPYLHFAADINGDFSIKVSDLTLLRKLILGVISDLPQRSEWRFYDAAHTFEDPNNPFSEPPVQIIEFQHLVQPVSYDFIGVEPGSIN